VQWTHNKDCCWVLAPVRFVWIQTPMPNTETNCPAFPLTSFSIQDASQLLWIMRNRHSVTQAEIALHYRSKRQKKAMNTLHLQTASSCGDCCAKWFDYCINRQTDDCAYWLNRRLCRLTIWATVPGRNGWLCQLLRMTVLAVAVPTDSGCASWPDGYCWLYQPIVWLCQLAD
jgi:hypothetical protein